MEDNNTAKFKIIDNMEDSTELLIKALASNGCLNIDFNCYIEGLELSKTLSIPWESMPIVIDKLQELLVGLGVKSFITDNKK